MDNLIWILLLAFLPISELRGAMLAAIPYSQNNNISLVFLAVLIVIVNILAIFFVFFFLDFLHKKFMKIKIYRRIFDYYMGRARKKADKLEKSMGVYGFLALTIFVAVPLPATGAWTGCLIAWYLGLDRKKSILSISLGVIAAGILVLLTILGFLKLF